MKRFMFRASVIAALIVGAIVEGRGDERGAAGQKQLDVKDLSPVTPAVAARHAPLVLAANGRPNAAIYVVENQPSEKLKILVRERVTVIELTTGATMGVVQKPPPPNGLAIVIGACQESQAQGIDAAKLPIEGFAVKTTANRIYLVGSTRPLEPGRAWGVRSVRRGVPVVMRHSRSPSPSGRGPG